MTAGTGAIGDFTDLARASAAVALGLICDPSAGALLTALDGCCDQFAPTDSLTGLLLIY